MSLEYTRLTHRTCLKTAEAAATRQSDVADVRRSTRWFRLVYDQCGVTDVASLCLLHLPEILQSLNDVHCTHRQTHTVLRTDSRTQPQTPQTRCLTIKVTYSLQCRKPIDARIQRVAIKKTHLSKYHYFQHSFVFFTTFAEIIPDTICRY